MAFFVPVGRLAILEQKVFWCYLMYSNMYMYVERRVQNVYIILLFGKHNLKKQILIPGQITSGSDV